MTQPYQFDPNVLAFFSEDRAWAEAQYNAEQTTSFWIDGQDCATPAEFVEQLARAVQFPGDELSLNILGQALSNLDWLEADSFTIGITDADLLFADGNPYMWQYLLEMARNIQANVEEYYRPAIRWLLQVDDENMIKELQMFFEEELEMIVPYL